MTKEYWDFGSAVYPARERTASYLEPLADLFSPKRTVVDLGCGRGEMLRLLKDRGHVAVGVDASERSERWASEAGAAFHKGDVLDFLSAPTRAFDAAFSYGLLEHLEPGAFARLFELLGRCPAGLEVVMATHDPSSIQAHLTPLYGDPTHQRLYSRATVEHALREQGFTIKSAGAIAQSETPVPFTALDPETNERVAARLDEAAKRWRISGSEREALEYARFACGRLHVVESILRDVTSLLNRPMDYYVFAVKERP